MMIIVVAVVFVVVVLLPINIFILRSRPKCNELLKNASYDQERRSHDEVEENQENWSAS